MEGRGATRRAVALGLVASALPFPARASGCGSPTRRQTEGPYYTPLTPRRADLREPGSDAEALVLEGSVLAADCRPVTSAVVDIWHCDEYGRYDNRGFRYRGHQVTDAAGAFRFQTIRPGQYPGRTPHIHVRVHGPGTRPLTTQVYFPDLAGANSRDGIYRDDLLLRLDRDASAGWRARFDLVLAPV